MKLINNKAEKIFQGMAIKAVAFCDRFEIQNYRSQIVISSKNFWT
jgi:hypothetical protein